MPLTRNPLRSRRRLALFVAAAALAASVALGALFVAKKRVDADLPSWPPSQPMRIDMPRDARIAELQVSAPDVPSGRGRDPR
jgi:hypothetical protein